MTRSQLSRLLLEGPVIRPLREYALSALGSQPPARVDRRLPAAPAAEEKTGRAQGEAEPAAINKKIAVYLNRAALRIFSVPSFQAYWKDVVLFQDDQARDGQCKIQFVFHRLPEEAHPLVIRLLAAPREPKLTRFTKDGVACTGVELEVKPEDFGGEDYDYAF